MTKKVSFKNNGLTLVGREVREGMLAPDFKVSTEDLSEVSLSNFKGSIKVIHSFPSLDTEVCDLQVKEFNKRAASISEEVKIIGISKDLPFAQKRFCSSFKINNIKVFSDYKTSSFGINYGLLIKELNLLARSALIIDKNDVIRYIQVGKEITQPLNYDDIFKNLQAALKNPKIEIKAPSLPSKCLPCEGEVSCMPIDRIKSALKSLQGWELVEDKKIVKKFKFKDFVEAKFFLDLIAVIAEEQGHHPNLTLIYNVLKVTLSTHAANGLTDNDFIMANIIDGLSL